MPNQTMPRIYVDAVPEKITACEQYAYKIFISASPDTEFLEAKASIELEVPYDGHRCFSKEAMKNLEEALSQQNGATPKSGLIGHLALGAPYNWETDLSRSAKPTFHPIEIPLQMGSFNKDQWGTDQWRVKVTEEYSLNDLHFPPIEVDIQMFDDVLSSPGTPFEEFIQQRFKENLLEGAVVFDFTVRVPLPKIVERPDVRVTLEELELAWPTIAAPWQMQWILVEPAGSQGNFSTIPQYNTQRRAILLENIPTEREIEDSQSPLVYYKSHLRMLMILPGLFITDEDGAINSRLSGKVKSRIDNLLLSGREIAWMRTSGALSNTEPPKIVQQTEILAEFSAVLSERSANRTLTTYRQWVFPGVNLTEARAADVAAALFDLGYHMCDMGQGRTVRFSTSGNSIETARMVADKTSRIGEKNELGKMQIEIQLKKVAAGTTARERELKGVVVSTDLPTSDLMLQLRGMMSTAGSLLDHDTAQLMNLLNKRFANVADLR